MRRTSARRRGAVAFAGWSLAAQAASLAAARLTGRDEHPAVIAAQSITGFGLLLPSLALGMAALARRRALAAVAMPLVALHLRWSLPEVWPFRPAPVEADHEPRLRVLSANLFAMNREVDDLAAEILAADADVLVLQELSHANLPALRRHGVLDAYPHRLLEPRADAFGSAILSRRALVDGEIWRAADMPMARGTVVVGDRPVRVYCVHPRAPFGPRGLARWRAELASVQGAIRDEPRPLIVAGDFNATWGHRRFRQFLAEGLRDAHVARGRGWVTTWPNDLSWAPPLARIDHVLVSEDFAVLAAREGAGKGSDHRPVVVDLALLRSPGPAAITA